MSFHDISSCVFDFNAVIDMPGSGRGNLKTKSGANGKLQSLRTSQAQFLKATF